MKTFSQIVYEDSGSHSNDNSKQKGGIFKLLGAIASGLFGGSGSSKDAEDAKKEREAIQNAKDEDREERRKFKQDLKNKKRSIKNKLKEMSIKTETAKRRVAHEDIMDNYRRQLDRLESNIALIGKTKVRDAHFYENLFNKAVESTAVLGISKDDNSELDECQMYVGMMLHTKNGDLIQPKEGETFEEAMTRNFADRYINLHGLPRETYFDGEGNLNPEAEKLLKEEMKKVPGLNKAFDAVKGSGSVENALCDALQIEPAAKLEERENKLMEMQEEVGAAETEYNNKVEKLDEQAKLAETVIQNNICRNLDAENDEFTKDGKYVKKGEKYYEVATGKEVEKEALKGEEVKKISEMEVDKPIGNPDTLITGDTITKEAFDELKRRGIIPEDCRPEEDDEGPYDIASLNIPDGDSAAALKAKISKYNDDLNGKNDKMQKTIEEKVNKIKSNAVSTYGSKETEWKNGLGIEGSGRIDIEEVASIRDDIDNKKREAENERNDATERIFRNSNVTPASREGIETELTDIGKKRDRAEEAKNEARQKYGPNAEKEIQRRRDAEKGIFNNISLSEFQPMYRENNKDDLKADDIEIEVPDEITYKDENGDEHTVKRNQVDNKKWEECKGLYYIDKLKEMEEGSDGERLKDMKNYKVTTREENGEIKIEITDTKGHKIDGEEAKKLINEYTRYQSLKTRVEKAKEDKLKELKNEDDETKRAKIKKQYGIEMTEGEEEALNRESGGGSDDGGSDDGGSDDGGSDDDEDGDFDTEEVEHDEEDVEDGDDEFDDETNPGTKLQNPSTKWHRRKLKNRPGSTKRYYDKDNNSITQEEFKEKLRRYRELKNRRSQGESNESLYQKKGMVIEFKSTTTFKPKYKQSSSSFTITKLGKSR